MSKANLAVVGMGVMGANLARNFHSRGFTVAVNNRSQQPLDDFMSAYGDERFVRCADLQAVVDATSTPRVIVLMVTAGRAVDAVSNALSELLEKGDIIVDGGNSYFPDTERRMNEMAEKGLRFIGMGVSGGEEGALLGPSMMPGGSPEAWEALKPLVEPAAAKSASGPCVTFCGTGGAGHFVKMVHNGIEYGDMQLIAESWQLLKSMGKSAPEIREVFEGWNAGRLESFLIELTAGIVAARDPQGDGPLVEQILDQAGQKGTGRWTAILAVENGVPLGTITAAVDGRALSSRKADRVATEQIFGSGPTNLLLSVEDLEQALYASKLLSYTQGFDLIRTIDHQRQYGINLAEVARIWTGGCIIRAEFLGRIQAAFTKNPELPLLIHDDSFAAELKAALPAWRRVVASAVSAGLPIPAMSASLAWFDTMRTGRGTACVIQAQRDWFGAHTYRRLSDPNTPVHTEWSELEQL